MAKEKTDAASLFDAMNKNRKKMTTEVSEKQKKTDQIYESKEDMVSENTVNTSDHEDKDADRNDKQLSDIVNDNDIITHDISEESDDFPGDSDEKEEKAANSDAGDPVLEENADRKGKELQHIHIALPLDVYEKLEIAKKAYYNNKTTYIRNLILDDYEKNKDYYDRLPNIR